jgi:hypothetical protein
MDSAKLRLLKTTPREEYGYKIGRRHRIPPFQWAGDKGKVRYEYGPVFYRLHERWNIGVWEEASGQSCHYFANSKAKQWAGQFAGWLMRKYKTAQGNKIPMIDSGKRKYPYGFHYYPKLRDAVHHLDVGSGEYLLFCQFRQLVAKGNQWGRKVKVAQKMMIMDVISFKEAQASLREGNGD